MKSQNCLPLKIDVDIWSSLILHEECSWDTQYLHSLDVLLSRDGGNACPHLSNGRTTIVLYSRDKILDRVQTGILSLTGLCQIQKKDLALNLLFLSNDLIVISTLQQIPWFTCRLYDSNYTNENRLQNEHCHKFRDSHHQSPTANPINWPHFVHLVGLHRDNKTRA